MAKPIYTTYQTNSFKIIKSTFRTYKLPHALVIFPSISVYSIVLKIPTEPKISDKLCRFKEGGRGGGRLPHLNFRHWAIETVNELVGCGTKDQVKVDFHFSL